ncbi:MAG: LLM class flavin-dependent oxidoreductase [Candidatus Caldarchaeum sp.]|nr:LLM class flavin-dependent oxidoreductase [Candidatus Caldarchaeum sp.]
MRRIIHFGVLLPDYCGGPVSNSFTTPDKLRSFCKTAEKLGFTSIWHREHFTSTSATPSSYESVATMSAVSQMVEKPRLGIITILPLRHPVILAKETATLDVLSNGRVSLCCAVGHREHEFEALGVNMADRGRRFVESVEILKKLWTENNVSWEGEFHRFSNVSVDPRPVQKPHPPLIIGSAGRSAENPQRFEKLLRRAAELGDGWYAAITMAPESVKKAVDILKTLVKRDVEKFSFMAHKYVHITDGDAEDARRTVSAVLNMSLEDARRQQLVGGKEEIIKKLEAFTNTGITHFNIAPLTFDHKVLEFFAEEVIPRYSP